MKINNFFFLFSQWNLPVHTFISRELFHIKKILYVSSMVAFYVNTKIGNVKKTKKNPQFFHIANEKCRLEDIKSRGNCETLHPSKY